MQTKGGSIRQGDDEATIEHSLICPMLLVSMENVLVLFLHCSSTLATLSASAMATPLPGSSQVTELLVTNVAFSSIPVLEMTHW